MPDYNKNRATPHVIASVEQGCARLAREAFLMQWLRDALSDGDPLVFRPSARLLDPDTETTWRTLTIERECHNLTNSPCGRYVNLASGGTEDDAHDLLEECILATMNPDARAEYDRLLKREPVSVSEKAPPFSDTWRAFQAWSTAHPDIVEKCKSVADLRARFEEMQGTLTTEDAS